MTWCVKIRFGMFHKVPCDVNSKAAHHSFRIYFSLRNSSAMGLVHTPRAIYSVGRAYMRRKALSPTVGLRRDNPHLYTDRAGVFDVDYLGHMNNAAYLTHAEFARWEMCIDNGLFDHMVRRSTVPVVTGAVIRYRREIKPLFRPFGVDTLVTRLNERHIWISQNFRHHCKNNNNDNDKKEDSKIRAQVLVQGSLVRGKTVVNPIDFLLDSGADPSLVDALVNGNDSLHDKEVERFSKLETSLRESATMDDKLQQEQ